MVKLAQTIGATGIAQGMRQPMNLGSHVIEVRQNLYSDREQKDATRVFPFSDIAYSGAEVAASNSVIASCHVPVIASLAVGPDQMQGLEKPWRSSLTNIKSMWNAKRNQSTKEIKWMQSGFGMADYIFGIAQQRSYDSTTKGGNAFDEDRRKLYRRPPRKGQKLGSVDGTAPLEVKQYLTEDDALNEITTFPSRMIIGYVIGPRDVKLYYTETAIGMMVRRLRRVVEALGPLKPCYYPMGLGHLAKSSTQPDPWLPKGYRKPNRVEGFKGTAQIYAPSQTWNAGSVTYKASALKATGSMYIPWDQTPYSTMRRNFKYNHILTQLGMEWIETFQAIGIQMNEDLNKSTVKPFNENGYGTQECALQLLFASMFGTTTTHNATSDFTADESAVAAGVKDKIGMMFNSGHIHIDPGVFMYERIEQGGFLDAERKGYLSSKATSELSYKGKNMSPEGLMAEFVAKYFTFCVAAQALESYFAVPLYQCHWLYVGSPKPEFVTEQLQMNFRSDVYFDGDNSLPFTLVPSRLNPGEVISRIPCYFNMNNKAAPNTYLGVRDPLPYGSVQDIRYNGDKPLTTIEERDYTYAPVIEADSSVQTQYRNSRTINCAVWPRPTHYSPGATRMGAIYGLMSDNASVGGHYYYQPLVGTMVNDNVPNVIYRSTMNNLSDSKAIEKQLFKGSGRKEIKEQAKYWQKHSIMPDENPQTISTKEVDIKNISDDPMPFPTTVTGRDD
jgi:hypothetical protein